jgi:hypothetical protein
VFSIVASLLFLAAAVLAFFAEPNSSAALAQNIVATIFAAVQTLDIIRLNVLLIVLFLAAWAVVAATMHDSIGAKSPAACIMLATAVHALFDRLRERTPVLGGRARRAFASCWQLAVSGFEKMLNAA